MQTFPPKGYRLPPEEFEPFGVGYIELDGQVRVEARLTESDPDRLRIGMPMRLVLEDLPAPGADVVFAFAPIEEDQ